MRNLAMCCGQEATRAVEIAQLVYASSDAVYLRDDIDLEATPPVPIDLYGSCTGRELMWPARRKHPWRFCV